MYIIKIGPLENNFHPYEFQSHRLVCWKEGYIAVPDELIKSVVACSGYCELDICDGQLVAVTAVAEPEEPAPEPTTEDDLMSLLIDLAYRTTLLELGVK